MFFPHNTMRIIIISWAQELTVEISVRESVLGIKHKIEHLLGVPAASQTLSVSGWELVDGLDMEDYPIVNEGTRIDLTIKPTNPEPMTHYNLVKIPIVVKFSARQMTIEVDRTETVRSLKEKIHILDGTPIKRMSLVVAGTELEDDFRNLTEYGIGELSEVVVFLKGANRGREEAPARRLSVAVQMSSSLMNAARIPVEVRDSGTVSELREMLTGQKVLPADDYLFVHKQRIMREHCSLRWHGVEDGDLLYVFRGTVTRNGY